MRTSALRTNGGITTKVEAFRPAGKFTLPEGFRAGLHEAERDLEKFKQESFAPFERLTGLTFDRETSRCTTPGKIRMEGELKGR